MRIGLVLPDPPTYSETFFSYKIRNLQESGFKIIVFSGKRTKEKFFFKHVGAYPISKQSSLKQLILFLSILFFIFIKSPSQAFKLFSLERKEGASILGALKIVYINAHIISYDLDWLHFGFATMSLKRENVSKAIGAKMGVSFRGYDINIYPLKNPNCYKRLWKNVDKIHSISDYLYERALKMGLSREKAFEKITPAIDVSLFKIKDDLGKIENPVTILSVGRLNWVKNYETAISAMKVLKDKGKNFVYNIIGTGKELERLKFAVYQNRLEDRVFFLGQMDHTMITEKMLWSDIYLQTSFQEGFCVSVLEAQATGLLSIVSDADGLKENVIDGVTGWTVPKRDFLAFANKILEVIELPIEKRREVAENARRRVESNFKIEDQKVKFKKFFTE